MILNRVNKLNKYTEVSKKINNSSTKILNHPTADRELVISLDSMLALHV